MRSASMKWSASSCCFGAGCAAATRAAPERENDVLPHRQIRHDSRDLAILGAEADPEPDRLPRALTETEAVNINVTPSAASTPKSRRAISVRPEPSSPASPTTSPLPMPRSNG